MKNIKPGDRVSFEYFETPDGVKKMFGCFEKLNCDGIAMIWSVDRQKFFYVVPSSMRLLKKKKREEIWVNIYPDIGVFAYRSKGVADRNADINRRIECVRFVRAKRQE